MNRKERRELQRQLVLAKKAAAQGRSASVWGRDEAFRMREMRPVFEQHLAHSIAYAEHEKRLKEGAPTKGGGGGPEADGGWVRRG